MILNSNDERTYTGGSGTNTLTFSYRVRPGQNSADLDYLSTTALALYGSTIQDALGNPANLTLPATGADGLAAQKIVIDTTAPTVTAIFSPQPTGAYAAGTTIPIMVTFNEPVLVTGTPILALNSSSNAVASYTGGSGTNALTFSYTVAAGDNVAELDYTSTAALALSGGTIQDAVGNLADPTLPAAGNDGLAAENLVIDTTPPTVTDVSSAMPAGIYGPGTIIPITVTFSEPVTVNGMPQLALNAGTGAVAAYSGGNGTSMFTFNYIVAAGQSACRPWIMHPSPPWHSKAARFKMRRTMRPT